MIAVAAPALFLMVGVGVEVALWSTVQQKVQRQADLGALAGAMEYSVSAKAQSAANAAADLAKLNGASGNAARTWNDSLKMLTDNNVIVKVDLKLRGTDTTGITVTVSQAVPLIFTKALTSKSAATMTASASAEMAQAQACLLALGKVGAGIAASANANVILTGCTVHSNAAISATANASISAPSIWAGGAITTAANGSISGTQHPNSGTLANPYAADAALTSAFGTLIAGQGTAISVGGNNTRALTAGTYSALTISGNAAVTLGPGRYYVNGPIDLGGNGSLTLTPTTPPSPAGTNGVTIITLGTLTVGANFRVALSAADITAPQGNPTSAIIGVVFAGNSALPSDFSGNAGSSLTGLVYYPNGALSFNANAANTSNGCLEIIASSIDLTANSSMANKCDAYNLRTFGDKLTLDLVK